MQDVLLLVFGQNFFNRNPKIPYSIREGSLKQGLIYKSVLYCLFRGYFNNECLTLQINVQMSPKSAGKSSMCLRVHYMDLLH